MSTTDETRTRSIPAILGWRPPLPEWGYAEGHWEHPTRGIVVDDRGGWDCDDMLRWLMGPECRGFISDVKIDCDFEHGFFVLVRVGRECDWRECHGNTLHAALEAAVRAVAEQQQS